MARLVVVSNRVAIPDGKSNGRAGGLEVAVQAALRHREGVWFGWSGKIARKGEAAETTTVRHDSIDYVVTSLGAEDYKEYYNGFANRVLWPVLHYRFDLAVICASTSISPTSWPRSSRPTISSGCMTIT